MYSELAVNGTISSTSSCPGSSTSCDYLSVQGLWHGSAVGSGFMFFLVTTGNEDSNTSELGKLRMTTFYLYLILFAIMFTWIVN